MKKILLLEAQELTSEITKIYMHIKENHALEGNTSCQFMARACCIIIGKMVESQSAELKRHIEHCLTAISCRDQFSSTHGDCVPYLSFYDGEIPHILAELEQAYIRIPAATKDLDQQPNNRQALRSFLDAVHHTLQGCNNQEYFNKPEFMNITQY
ncbi:hypothetical protein [Vibrio parahaemolyticus]|uniref:hypothetical protein n=1 Tax=Vibrio parahaemolyticus TaxID=670 RepID=UPI0004A2F0D9|nr:hypothetical protein [Vibrio parahaemolyticus]